MTSATLNLLAANNNVRCCLLYLLKYQVPAKRIVISCDRAAIELFEPIELDGVSVETAEKGGKSFARIELHGCSVFWETVNE